jgi:hypothetical protein
MFDPALTGRSIVSMVRVPVRTGADMADSPALNHAGTKYYTSDTLCENSLQASSLDSARAYAGMSVVGRRR